MEKFLKGKNIGKYMGISIKDVNIASISPMIQHLFYYEAKKSSKYGVEGFLYFFYHCQIILL